MHKDISGKIKRLGESIMYLGALVSLALGVLAAIQYSGEPGKIICLLIIGVGCGISYFISVLTYGFGELIEKTSDNAYNIQQMIVLLNEIQYKSDKGKSSDDIMFVAVQEQDNTER